MQVRSKVWLAEKGNLVFGTGKVKILRAVMETGSLNGAAKLLDMSYRHVWSSIHAIEQRLGRNLLTKNKGGKNGGGAVLTTFAEELMLKFEQIDADVQRYADERFAAVFTRKASRKRSKV